MPAGAPGDLDAILAGQGVRVIDRAGWQALDKHEIDTGRQRGRPRVKVVDRTEQVRLARAGTALTVRTRQTP